MRTVGRALVAAGKEFAEDKVPRLAASLSYYTIFSLPPLLVILIGVAGIAFGPDVVRERLVSQLGGLVGEDSARLLGDAIREAEQTGQGAALVIGIATLLVGAGGVVGQLKSSLNTVWDVESEKGGGIGRFIRTRFVSLAAVLGAGFLLLVSLALSAVIGALVDTFERFDAMAPFIAAIDIIGSFLVITVVFALMFKYLPDAEIAWPDVWIGAAITSALFGVGKFAIGFYLGASDVGSAYGAAGSLIIVLVWIYYSSLILFFGAEFTQVWSLRHSRGEIEAARPAPVAQHAEAGRLGPGVAWITLLAIGWLARRRAGAADRRLRQS